MDRVQNQLTIRPHWLRWVRAGIIAAIACFATNPPVAAQDRVEPDRAIPDSAWNSDRALQLIERARQRRMLPQQDTSLHNYTARAEGFVYFYLDRRDSDERTLVKVDQVALELFWAPPDRTSQRIVGLRDVSRLPNRMNYHLDHLTVVQNGFGDVIRMGDGDEVSDVPHPAAPGSDSIYEFRLADSLSLRMPGAAQIRVYEIEVRPLRTDRSALVGSLFVERTNADIVRMNFTFTPASYVDRRLDYIAVSLDNGLWEGRYWLPNEQTLQIRRQIPELDFAAGAIIQGRMRIGNYTFNDSTLSPAQVAAIGRYAVSAVPAAQREAYEFEQGIYDDLDDAGLAPPPDLATIRRQAAELLGSRRLSGLPRFRLGIGSVSSAFRYNRAEGAVIGAGMAFSPDPVWRLDISGGYAFGAERPWTTAGIARDVGNERRMSLRAGYRMTRDLSPVPDASAPLPGAVNTLSAILLGRDYTDLWYATGARLRVTRPIGQGRIRSAIELIGERHRSAELTRESAPFDDGDTFRPVRPIDEGDLGAVVLSVHRAMPDPRADDWTARLDVEIGTFEDATYARPTVQARVRRSNSSHTRDIELNASAGYLTRNAPSQRLFLIGGIGTLPGYPFRSFAGRRFVLADVQASVDLVRPWLRLRAVGAVGATDDLTASSANDAWQQWGVRESDGLRASIGAGVSLLWDVIRIDAVRGVNGGSWRLNLSFQPDLLDVS